jgi:hypothetical protein
MCTAQDGRSRIDNGFSIDDGLVMMPIYPKCLLLCRTHLQENGRVIGNL